MDQLHSKPVPHLSSRPVPKARGLPLIGPLPWLASDIGGYLMRAQARYGDIYQLNLGFVKSVVVTHPRHFQHIYIDNARKYRKAGPLTNEVRKLLGNGSS